MTKNEDWSSISLLHKKEGDVWFTLRLDSTKGMEDAGEEMCREAFEEMVFEMRRVIDDRFGLIKKP